MWQPVRWNFFYCFSTFFMTLIRLHSYLVLKEPSAITSDTIKKTEVKNLQVAKGTMHQCKFDFFFLIYDWMITFSIPFAYFGVNCRDQTP